MRSVGLLTLLFLVSLASGAVELRSTIYDAKGTVEWTPKDFAGFFFHIDDNLGAEYLRLNVTAGTVEYGSKIQEVTFSHDNWGRYRVLCFLGKKYFTGYDSVFPINDSWNESKNPIFLKKILIDTNEPKTIAGNEILPLAEGYRLEFADAENGIRVSLYKGNILMNSTVLAYLPADYIYQGKVDGQDITQIAAHIKGSVRLTPDSYYTVMGLFQLSENTTLLNTNSEYGQMKVESIDESGLLLTIINKIDFMREGDLEILPGINLTSIVLLNGAKKIYLHKNASESERCEIRGTITDLGVQTFAWNPNNFAGFAHGIDWNSSFEQLTLQLERTMDDRSGGAFGGNARIFYVTIAQKKALSFNDWGHCYILHFLGKDYFAGYSQGDDENKRLLWQNSGTPNIIVYSYLTEVLADLNSLQTIKSGDRIQLKEGYEARFLVSDDCSKVFVELYKNGNLTDRDYFSVPHTYTYGKDLGDSINAVVLALHVSDLNCTGEKSCALDGIFQISENIYKIDKVKNRGRMSIIGINANPISIIMSNENEPFMLRKDRDIELFNDIFLKTANQKEITAENSLRYYIYKKVCA